VEEQQNESCAQIALTQMSHVAVSLAPVVQAEWAQVMRLQLSSQIESTSPVQTESHEEEQQTESCAQIFAAHESHDAVRAPPVEQIECAQPAAVHVPAALQVWPVAQVPQVPPQPSLPQFLPVQLGVQVVVHVPAALQVWPVAQVPQVPPQPSLPQFLPVQLGTQTVPPLSTAPFGVPMPVGPSQPVVALHRALVQVPFEPVVMSKNCVVCAYGKLASPVVGTA
jgi:hypothetical protein